MLLGRAAHDSPPPHLLRFAAREGVRVWYDVVASPSARRWSVAIVGYDYSLRERDGVEVLAYHWHPTGPSPVTAPHLHVGGRTAPVDLSKVRLPTGPVSLAAVVRMTIADLGVEPLRPDWHAVLDRAERELAG